MRNITPAKLIELIVWDVLYVTLKKKKIFPEANFGKIVFSTHPPELKY
jgi:hypothetical protein